MSVWVMRLVVTLGGEGCISRFELRLQASGWRVYGARRRIWGVGFRLEGVGYRVHGEVQGREGSEGAGTRRLPEAAAREALPAAVVVAHG